MRKQAGFTLIELVVVIVILGILAATAAPKFIDLTSDARASVVEGLQGALKSARDMGHAKALIDSETGSSDVDITVAGESVTFAYGWPKAEDINLLIDLDGDISEVSSGQFEFIGAEDQTECSVTYTDSTDVDVAPEVSIDTDKC